MQMVVPRCVWGGWWGICCGAEQQLPCRSCPGRWLEQLPCIEALWGEEKWNAFQIKNQLQLVKKHFYFYILKKTTKNPTQTTLPFLMQLVSSWPKRVLGEKCLCLAETQPGCGARWLDAWGRWVLFAVAKSTICLLAVFPKAVWQAVWEENIQKNKISAENGKHVSWHSSALVYQSPSPVLHLIQHRVFVAAGNFIDNHP